MAKEREQFRYLAALIAAETFADGIATGRTPRSALLEILKAPAFQSLANSGLRILSALTPGQQEGMLASLVADETKRVQVEERQQKVLARQASGG